MPLSLNGVGRLMQRMDWGPAAELISRAERLGAEEVEGADAFVLIAPQVGWRLAVHCGLAGWVGCTPGCCEAAGPNP